MGCHALCGLCGVVLDHVDPQRIGCAGLSLGGEMTMWLGAMDTRIAATISSEFLTVMDQMEKNHRMCWKFDGLRERIDYADIYSLTAPRPLQCQNGLKEGPTQFHVPIARKAMQEIRVIYDDYGKKRNAELDVHPGGHEIDLPALLEFFKKHLERAELRVSSIVQSSPARPPWAGGHNQFQINSAQAENKHDRHPQ